MKESFWLDKWQKNDIGFHEQSGNSLLAELLPELSLSEGDCVFLPLCGKTRDIAWLKSKGLHTVGAELSEMAVQQLFQELGVIPQTERVHRLKRYHGDNTTVFVGDIFDLDAALLGTVDAIYDRAALVALPADMRKAYTGHLMDITGAAPQLLITFEYEQSLLAGPPFSVSSRAIFDCYEANYQVRMLRQREVPGGLKGRVPAQEVAWLLTPR
ncbi:thiopurine S-methyltransferase [Microbulbifer sp. 2205BS26-8]|uniref:thiopurine S-methyltransferase n=1 Tax=Microbulbifer sp. 2205BS26-8 TaxID=3064386 RepID=UPI00273D2D31|nr:thiopurine S-methyltransferase [Microbulbifer sp. 2205BS26-8]MDP5208354.1 thiopurine S-methyltransferase [Microbulbifer sp. 2205BS26-8]